jgi:energy-coupling factor transporter transmembrane protein EcfT
MDARGFGALPNRTYYQRIVLKPSDWLFLFASVVVTVALLLILARLGLLRGFLVGLSDTLYGGRP